MKSVVDHIIIAVADLEQATQDYTAMLGRKPSWQGSHPDYGTANSLFRLDNSYLELLAATGAGWAADAVNGHIATKGQGLMGLVFGTDDAEAFVAHANAHGLEASAPIAGHGLDANSGARRDWRNMVWDTKAARGIFSFAIQHDDPEVLPMAEPMDFYGKQLGVRLALEQSRPEWGGDMLFFRCNSMSIEVIGSDKYDAEQDALWGLALKTGDIDATHKRLTGAGIDVSEIRDGRKPGTRVCTVKSHCLDVPTLIVGLVN
jgi:catechol 2,3-dioxygenase-like lactoylglutathione lyase family enzyme